MDGKNPFQPGRAAFPKAGSPPSPPPPPPAPPAPGPGQNHGRAVLLGVIGLALLIGVAVLAYNFWVQREVLKAQRRDLTSLQDQRQSMIQTNRQLSAERDQARESLSRSEKERQQQQEELQRLQTELQRLEQEHRSATEARGRLEDEMRTALQSRDITISELAGKLTVNILDRVLFASGEAEIKTEGQDVLRKVAEVLKGFPDRQIHVIGHTDNVPIRTARFPSNWELSAARALAAVRFLTEQADVDPHRLGALGHGEFYPVADNSTPEGRAQNRRIAIVVLPELLRLPPEPLPPVPTPTVPTPTPAVESEPVPVAPPEPKPDVRTP